MTTIEPDITVVASGFSAGSDRNAFSADIRSRVRYADGAAWTVLAAMSDAAAAVRDLGSVNCDRVAVIVVTESGPKETIASLIGPDGEPPSPLRFAAATPASLVGVACMARGYRGPTCTLTMPARDGLPIAQLLARRWLARKTADVVFVTLAEATASGSMARCEVLASNRGSLSRHE
jgi:hypothetical protein